jgi:hypothetical protein
LLLNWEDRGGPLPLHNVGLSAGGRVPLARSLGLRYVAEFGNGRDYTNQEPVQVARDYTPGKSWNFALTAQPDVLPGWRMGVSMYRDHPIAGPEGLRQTLFSTHLAYFRGRDEFINEAIWMRNRSQGETTSLPGFYSQYSRRFGSVRPYARYEYTNATMRDPIAMRTLGDLSRYRGLTTGVRYEISEFAAFKAEFERFKMAQGGMSNRAGVQVAFTF